MSIRTGISLGSNLGNRLANLRVARDMLVKLNTSDEDLLQSSLYQTDPVGCPPNSPDFYNAVVEISYNGSAHELLTSIQGIEWHLGRVPTAERNAPRKIDLDILYFGDTVVDEDVLTLPHPRLTDRRFVLKPLADICPGLTLPGDYSTIREHLRRLDSDEPEPTLVQSMW